MTLVDRVLSLVAVDALTRPFDFERAFFVCERCHLPASTRRPGKRGCAAST